MFFNNVNKWPRNNFINLKGDWPHSFTLAIWLADREARCSGEREAEPWCSLLYESDQSLKSDVNTEATWGKKTTQHLSNNASSCPVYGSAVSSGAPHPATPWHFLFSAPVRVWENAPLFYVGPLAQNTQGPSSAQLHPPQGKLLWQNTQGPLISSLSTKK